MCELMVPIICSSEYGSVSTLARAALCGAVLCIFIEITGLCTQVWLVPLNMLIGYDCVMLKAFSVYCVYL